MAKPILLSMPRSNLFDQWRLTEAGGVIVIGKNGIPQFKFATDAMYRRYQSLNSRRDEFYERASTG